MPKFSQNVISWAFFDFAETVFSANIISVFLPLIIVSHYGGKSYMYSIVYSLSILVSIFLGVLLGKVADKKGLKLIFFKILVVLVGIFLGILAYVNSLHLTLAVFFILNIMYQLSLVFYNSVLFNISTSKNISFISGLGIGIGYIGGIIAMVLTNIFGKNPNEIFFITFLLFILFSLPSIALLKIEKKGFVSFSIKEIFKDKVFLYFMISIFLLTDAVHGLIIFMAIYLNKVFGFDTSKVISVIALAGIFAVLWSPMFGKLLDKKLNPVISLKFIFLFWVFAFWILIFSNNVFIYFVGVLFGVLIGSTWTVLRVILINISPKGQLSSRFAIFSASERFASIISPTLWGVIVFIFGENVLSYKLSVFVISLFPLLGFFVFKFLFYNHFTFCRKNS